MKLVKLTMLAVTAALAASASIGAPSASAITHKWGALCDAQQLLLCEASHLIKHPLLGKVRLLMGEAAFNAGFVTIKCSSGEGETNAVESQQLEAFGSTLESLTFAGCSGCTGIAVTVPQVIKLTMETEGGEAWALKAEGSKVKFSGCPFGTTCTYQGNLNFKVQMDAEGSFSDPEGKELSLVEGGGLCAAASKWQSGRTRVDWKLDDAKGSIHTKIWPTLLEALTKAEGKEL